VGGIFISYRREDAAHSAGRLYERLVRDFPRNQLLMDVDAIEPGLDFVKVLDEQVSGCDVLLALIGPNWADAKNEKGVRRLDDPDDFVRIEIASALERDIRVIPILVDGAPMPRAEELPEPLKPLARRNAIQVSHVRFGADTQGLVEVLRRVTKPVARVRRGLFRQAPKPPSEQRPLSPLPPTAAQLPDKSDVRTPIGRKNRVPLAAAITFGILSFPITFGITVLVDKGGTNAFVAGAVASATVMVMIAVALLSLRGRSAHGAEIALFWLGSTSSVAFAMGPLFENWHWDWFGAWQLTHHFFPGIVTGWLVGATLIVATATAMASWRRTALTRAEIAIYGLASAISVAIAMALRFA
jgi:hypothetical protein